VVVRTGQETVSRRLRQRCEETEQALTSALAAALKSNCTAIVAARIDASGYAAQFNAMREL
jgi:hypothetical protein